MTTRTVRAPRLPGARSQQPASSLASPSYRIEMSGDFTHAAIIHTPARFGPGLPAQQVNALHFEPEAGRHWYANLLEQSALRIHRSEEPFKREDLDGEQGRVEFGYALLALEQEKLTLSISSDSREGSHSIRTLVWRNGKETNTLDDRGIEQKVKRAIILEIATAILLGAAGRVRQGLAPLCSELGRDATLNSGDLEGYVMQRHFADRGLKEGWLDNGRTHLVSVGRDAFRNRRDIYASDVYQAAGQALALGAKRLLLVSDGDFSDEGRRAFDQLAQHFEVEHCDRSLLYRQIAATYDLLQQRLEPKEGL